MKVEEKSSSEFHGKMDVLNKLVLMLRMKLTVLNDCEFDNRRRNHASL